MMQKFTPLEKMSKKERQAFHKSQRGTWGAINPVTRKPGNPKAYNRKKVRQEERFFDAEPFFAASSEPPQI